MISFIPAALAEDGLYLGGTDLTQISLVNTIYLFAALAILAAGLLSIVFIFWGGFSFILSGGDEGKVKEAVHTIRYAIIGLVVSLLSLVVVNAIGMLFNVNYNILDRQFLSQTINEIFYTFRGLTAEEEADRQAQQAANEAAAQSVDQLIQ